MPHIKLEIICPSIKSEAIMLYELLSERETYQSISHKKMPSYDEHRDFIIKNPYFCWYWIRNLVDMEIFGAIYLTRQREIGVSIFKRHRRRGYADHAIRLLMIKHPGEFLANINPQNQASVALFKKLDFELIQHTYRLP